MHQWLRAEFLAARDRIRPHHRAWFQERDVLPSTLEAIGGFGVARIAVDGNRFDIVPQGDAAALLPVFDVPANPELNGLYDLVAFRPSEPARLYRRRGEATWLGGFALARALDLGETLALYRTPLSWLQSGADGAVALDWTAAPRMLLELPAIEAEDEAFAAEIQERVRAELLKAMPSVRTAMKRAAAPAVQPQAA